MKCMVMFQYSICDWHFGIMKSELILGISVGILKFFSDKLFFLNSARRQTSLFVNKDLIRIELSFLKEVSIIVRVGMKPLRLFFLFFFIHFCSAPKQQD